MWRGPPLFIQVVKVSCYSRQFILIIRYTVQHFLFKWASHLTFSHPPLRLPRPEPCQKYFSIQNIFLNPIHQPIVLRDETCAANDRCDGDGRPLRCGKIFFVEDENNFSLLVVSSAETGDRCVSARRKMIDGGGDLTFKLKHLSLVSATSFLYILHKL